MAIPKPLPIRRTTRTMPEDTPPTPAPGPADSVRALLCRLGQGIQPGEVGSAEETAFPDEDLRVLLLALEDSDEFRRDTGLGGIFHPGKISFREVRATDSLHIIIDGNRISAHVDKISPLACDPSRESHYSMAAVLAHNVAGFAADVVRRIRGRHGEQRCDLECDVVWVDEES